MRLLPTPNMNCFIAISVMICCAARPGRRLGMVTWTCASEEYIVGSMAGSTVAETSAVPSRYRSTGAPRNGTFGRSVRAYSESLEGWISTPSCRPLTIEVHWYYRQAYPLTHCWLLGQRAGESQPRAK